MLQSPLLTESFPLRKLVVCASRLKRDPRVDYLAPILRAPTEDNLNHGS
jgi:hypothetical protein